MIIVTLFECSLPCVRYCQVFYLNYCPYILWEKFAVVKLSQLSMISVDCEGTECIPGAREGQGVAQSKEAGAEEHNFFIARLGLSEQE